MIEFEKWQIKRRMRIVGYIDNADAYADGKKAGWKAALRWVKTLLSSGTYKFTEPTRFINEELNNE